MYVNDFLGVAIITVIMGFLRTWIHVPLPLVFGDYLPPERYDQLNRNGFSSNEHFSVLDFLQAMDFSCSSKEL